jgi:exopolyphosphatase/guanosine-5'-triphosphate,3'-diphosphate pyrophosphatase
LNKDDKDKIKKLAGILRIADGLDRGHKSVIKDIEITSIGKNLSLLLKTEPGSDVSLEIWGANLRKQLFEEAFETEITIQTQL